MTEQPNWFTWLQRDLNAPALVTDSAVIDWDQCRDRFLIPLLQRLETRTSSYHPAIVRQLLARRLAGDDVAAQLSAACTAALVDAAVDAAVIAAATVAAATVAAARSAVIAAATAAAAAARSAVGTAFVERAAQLLDLRAAIAASTQPPALSDNYIDDNITGPDRELLTAFYEACNSEGGTADEIHLRGIRAALAQAASGFIVPTTVQVAQPLPPFKEALQRLLQWGGWQSSIGYSADVVLGVVDWANGGMVGPLPPLPEWLRLREAAQPPAPAPTRVDLAELRDSTFSDGLTAAQHRDVLRGGPDPRRPAPTDDELLQTYERARRAYKHEGAMNEDWLLEERRGHELAGLRAVLAQFNAWAQGLAPLPVADLPWEQPGWRDDDGQCWWTDDRQIWWTSVDPTQLGIRGWVLPHWAIPAVPTEPAEVQP